MGVPNTEHRMEILFDGKPLEMIGGALYRTVKAEGTASTREVPINFMVPADASLGEHAIRVRTYDTGAGVAYDSFFGINVIPFRLLALETPSELTVKKEVELKIENIPSMVFLTGQNQNVIIEQITLGENLGTIKIPQFVITQNGSSAKIAFTVPYEAGKIRKGEGPINVDMLVKVKAGSTSEIMQAVQILNSDYGRTFSGLTKAGKKPILVPLCEITPKSDISFVWLQGDGIWKSVTAQNPFELGSGSLFIEGTGFGCYKKLDIEMVADDGAEKIRVSPDKNLDFFTFNVPESGWEGKFEKRAGIEIAPLDAWNVVHGAVDLLTVSVQDGDSHKATGDLHLFTQYALKVAPGEGAVELKPSGPLRIWWKGFIYGHKVRLNIDGESIRNIILERGSLDRFGGREMNYIDDLSVPSWISSGSHTLTFEDISELDAKGKVKYRASTTFIVPEAKVKIVPVVPKIKAEPKVNPLAVPVVPPITPDPVGPDTLCPSGSTYSYTFKQCMQEVPDKLSPYDGLPCPPEGSVPSYTTRGCVVQ